MFEVIVSELLSEMRLQMVKIERDKSDIEEKTNQILERQFIKTDVLSTLISEDNVQRHSTYRVMQWNILAQALSSPDNNFVRCPHRVLNWPRRQLWLVYEMLRWCPDVICLEEVDHFEYFEQMLSRVGYRGLFHPKVSSPCLEIANNNGSDGCAIFYRSDRLQILSCHPLVLHCAALVQSPEAISNSNIDLNRLEKDSFSGQLLKTSQVALAVEFLRLKPDSATCLKGNDTLWVCTTHLKSKSPFSDVRAQQARWLLDEVNLLRKGAPLILCGDLNAPPSEPAIKEVLNLSLQSAYPLVVHSNNEPFHSDFTTWKFRGRNEDAFDKHFEVCHAIDYIWYSAESWQPRGRLSLPSKDAIGPNGLPCASYPSDHLALCADLTIL